MKATKAKLGLLAVSLHPELLERRLELALEVKIPKPYNRLHLTRLVVSKLSKLGFELVYLRGRLAWLRRSGLTLKVYVNDPRKHGSYAYEDHKRGILRLDIRFEFYLKRSLALIPKFARILFEIIYAVFELDDEIDDVEISKVTIFKATKTSKHDDG